MQANISANSAQPAGQTYNLRQIERVVANSVEDKVLQPVDDVEELLAQRSHVCVLRCS